MLHLSEADVGSLLPMNRALSSGRFMEPPQPAEDPETTVPDRIVGDSDPP